MVKEHKENYIKLHEKMEQAINQGDGSWEDFLELNGNEIKDPEFQRLSREYSIAKDEASSIGLNLSFKKFIESDADEEGET